MELDELRRELPDDAAERVLFALDCANAPRTGLAPELLEAAPLVARRRPPPRQHAASARSTSSSRTPRRRARSSATCCAELGVELTPEIAEALYVALVTDTGRFQYANTTPKALRLAAELVEAGVDVHRVFQGIYESVEFAKLKLLAKALERAELYEGGRLVITYLLRERLQRARRGGGVRGGHHRLPARGRRHRDGGHDPRAARARRTPQRRISMRAASDELDVSAIARQARRRRAPSGRRLLERESVDEIKAFLQEEFRRATARA